MNYFLLLLMLFPACGREEINNVKMKHEFSINPEFEAIMYDFEADAGKFNKPVIVSQELTSIEFVSEGKDKVLGTCIDYNDGTKKITIRQEYWTNLHSIIKKRLLYHELGHCVLNRSHYEAKVNKIDSIMSPYIGFYDYDITYKNWDMLIDELFNPEQFHSLRLANNHSEE